MHNLRYVYNTIQHLPIINQLLFSQIDPLLTPTGRKLRTGTRAVARQLRSDILPSLASQRAPSLPSMDWSKIGVRFFNAVQKQVIQGIETALSDLSNPGNIPNRLSQQTSDLIKEASNIFSETPIGLKEPSYTVIKQTDDYEIRDYARYKVASVNLDATDVGQTTAGFNTLAAYIFGANRGNQVLEMTTPVMTTMSGEMRFYLASDSVPDPLAFDESKNVYEQDRIFLSDIPAARLAIRRFTGFVTDGEVMRQKQALLTALALDGVELDVPHGQTVGHVVFQYNPPYTLPVLRRNELAVAVLNEQDDPWQNSVEERA